MLALLGTPVVLVDGKAAVGPSNQKSLALLAFLAMERRRPHPRAMLAAQFWPEQPENLASQNLRQLLARIRRAIGDCQASPPHLLVSPHDIQFNQASDYWLDVEAFDDLLDGADRHAHRRVEACPPCVTRLADAVGIYGGPLLDGLHLAGADASFEEWLTIERERLSVRACAAMASVAACRLASGEPENARLMALRLLRQDPWNEAAERIVMRAIALTEGRNQALEHYREFRAHLLRDLGVEPEDPTRDLEAEVRSGGLARENPHLPVGHIPMPAAPLIGRQAEIASVRGHLGSRDRRLVTIHGPGGSGKTRLALEVADREAGLWRDGVWFISVAEVASAEELPGAVAAALDIPALAGQAVLEAVLAHLRGKEALLVLDSFEHLVPGAKIVDRILRSAPRVNVLVTSRARLGLREEWVVAIDGFPVPEDPRPTPEIAAQYEAVQLFVRFAEQAAPGFELTLENVADVVRICRLVAGLPLGIEIAAAWVRVLSCHDTAEEIARSAVSLHEPGKGADGPSRSLRGTFTCSYDQLSPAHQTAFRQLAVFRDGFTAEAAYAVAGADSDILASLVDRSLVRRLQSGRLDIHAVVAELAAERLAADQAENQATRDRHREHYLALVRQNGAMLSSNEARQAAVAIGAEHANVRAAWLWAVGRGDQVAVREVVLSLSAYFFHAGFFPEAEGLMGTAADQFLATAGDDAGALALVARLRAEQADFVVRRGVHGEAARLAEEAAALARAAGDTRCQADAEFRLAVALRGLGQGEAARDHLERALELDRAGPEGRRGTDATSLMRRCLNDLAALCWHQGDLAAAEGYLEQMRELAVRRGNRSDEAVALGNLGLIAEERGDYAVAQKRYAESQALADALGKPRGAGYVNLGELYLEVAAYDQAEENLKLALESAREQGVVKREAAALSDLGLLAHYRGHDALALEHASAALDIVRRTDDPWALAETWVCLGQALTGLGRLDEAADAFSRALEVRRSLGQVNRLPSALAGLAVACLLRGRMTEALEHVEAILDHLARRSLDGTRCRSDVYLACYRVLGAAGDPRAPSVLEAAYRQLQERAASIADDDMRRTFREGVPANRAILEAWRVHAGRTTLPRERAVHPRVRNRSA